MLQLAAQLRAYSSIGDAPGDCRDETRAPHHARSGIPPPSPRAGSGAAVPAPARIRDTSSAGVAAERGSHERVVVAVRTERAERALYRVKKHDEQVRMVMAFSPEQRRSATSPRQARSWEIDCDRLVAAGGFAMPTVAAQYARRSRRRDADRRSSKDGVLNRAFTGFETAVAQKQTT